MSQEIARSLLPNMRTACCYLALLPQVIQRQPRAGGDIGQQQFHLLGVACVNALKRPPAALAKIAPFHRNIHTRQLVAGARCPGLPPLLANRRASSQRITCPFCDESHRRPLFLTRSSSVVASICWRLSGRNKNT